MAELPDREPGAALRAIHEAAPAPPGEVNMFGVPAGEVVDRRFDLDRLRRVRVLDGPDPDPAA
ncbi:hypothetical protein [Streptomyces sp. NPDC001401]|uniref:hypothetical protein n=1 Tax=Streptomyces sp. NPDC001401 TaxID=3364570 RepID=UPI003678D27E